MHMVVGKVVISKQERSGKLCSSLQPKWRAQAILPDAIKLGGARLATKRLKPSQAILPDAIKPGGGRGLLATKSKEEPRNHSLASGTKWLAQAILPDAIKTGVSTACDEKSSSSHYNEVNTIRYINELTPAILSDAIKRAGAWFTKMKYVLNTFFALSEVAQCIYARTPTDFFICLTIWLNSRPPVGLQEG
ncbi:hypothetical protein B0H14DRAFT_2560454 [Mycena olivaceomarginata]|nr:hypothetical protein B0H14DRAFT_2560454 [Mycena olivaceomarginata]